MPSDVPAPTCDELFRRSVTSFGDRSAVESAGGVMSYRELDARVSAWAARIGAAGSGQFVGLSLRAGPEWVAALFGIWRAGRCAVLFDADYPASRTEVMLGVVDLSALIGETTAALPDGVELISEPPPDGATVADPSVASGDPAFIVFTSGTTGAPKGCLNTHGGLANEAVTGAEIFGWGPETRLLQLASTGFDAGLEEVCGTLFCGGTLVFGMRPPFPRWIEFSDELIAKRITALDMTTSLWAAWVQALAQSGGELPPDLRAVTVGGEAVPPGAYQTWQRLNQGRVRWINTYGPSEAAVVAAAYVSPDQPGAVVELPEIPVGTALPGVRLKLVKEDGQAAGDGEAGELWIGGIGTSLGYLNQPEKTAASFVEDEDGRFYRTGDWMVRGEDGLLLFRGRRDRQVKLRGHRIELEEVETAVGKVPGLVASAVEPIREGDTVVRLQAFVVLAPGTEFSVEAARREVASRLPRTAVPDTWTVLKELPRTPHDKVDRAALVLLAKSAVGEVGKPPIAVGTEDPDTAALGRCLGEALGLAALGPDDDFFEQGGDSLGLLQAVEAAWRRGYRVEPEDIVRHPTPGQLWAFLASDTAGEREWSPLVPLKSGTRKPLFLIHSTPGDVMAYGALVHHLGGSRPCVALTARGLHDPEQTHRTIGAMADAYLDAILEEYPEGPWHLFGWCFGGIVAAEIATRMLDRGLNPGLLALADADARPANSRWLKARRFWRRGLLRLKLGPQAFSRTTTGKAVAAVPIPGGDFDRRAHPTRRPSYKIHLMAYDAHRSRLLPVPMVNFYSLDNGPAAIVDPTGGWNLLGSRVTSVPVPGPHEDMLKTPAVELIAAKLEEFLAAAESP